MKIKVDGDTVTLGDKTITFTSFADINSIVTDMGLEPTELEGALPCKACYPRVRFATGAVAYCRPGTDEACLVNLCDSDQEKEAAWMAVLRFPHAFLPQPVTPSQRCYRTSHGGELEKLRQHLAGYPEVLAVLLGAAERYREHSPRGK
jgi:hypothetical protein